MPYYKLPPTQPTVQLDADSSPFKLPGDPINDAWACEIVESTLQKFESWRVNNCDPRWRLNEWLYYGYVPRKVWEGSSVPRANYPVQIAFDMVESAKARLRQELLNPDAFDVSPTGAVSPIAAQQIKGRLDYILDNSSDDYGWSAKMELSETIKDNLIYGCSFALTEWDYQRKQATVCRVDPRDVYVDPFCPGPYIEKARGVVIKKSLTLDEVDSMRDYEDFKIPSKEVLLYFAQQRMLGMGDREKADQEAARGVRYLPTGDDTLSLPSSKLIDLFIYMGRGREIWVLGRGQGRNVCIFNKTQKYDCIRLVSAPCFPVPNRFYSQSFVDIIDPMQNVMTGLLNRHLDETNLAMNPPRVEKRGQIRTPNSGQFRPGLMITADDPKNDVQFVLPSNITQNVWQTMQYLETRVEKMLGQNSLATSGQPAASNANRTKGGVQMQLQAPTDRLAEIAWNIENYMIKPMLFKLLKIEKYHAMKENS